MAKCRKVPTAAAGAGKGCRKGEEGKLTGRGRAEEVRAEGLATKSASPAARR